MTLSQQPCLYVLVAGPPGSGKTTVSVPLAAELGLPLLAKDAIKEALMDALGRPIDVDASRRLGRVAVLAMLTVARTCPGAVMDSTWYPYTWPLLQALPGRLLEVRCTCPVEVARERYYRRSVGRHPGHLDAQRAQEELWNAENTQPLGIAPVVTVDTTSAIDVPVVAAAVRAAVDAPTRD